VCQQKGRSERQIAHAFSPEHEGPKAGTEETYSERRYVPSPYAAPVWAKVPPTPSYISSVARTHRLCATRISCAFRKYSEKAALVIAGLVPVQELVRRSRPRTTNLGTCLREGTFPRRWKVLGPGKPPGEASSYRPICLLHAVGKVFEKLISKRLNLAVDAAGGLSPTQIGFRKGKSMLDAIQTVTGIAAEGIRGKS